MSLVTGTCDDRVMVFVDLRNMTSSVHRDSWFSRIDLVRLAEYLNAGRNLKRAYVFDGEPKGANDRTGRFHARLRYLGFTVVTEPSSLDEGRGQKGVDVALACKALYHALRDDYDVAILVSGDLDFFPLVGEIKNAGKKVEVASYRGSTSGMLIQAADVYSELDEVPVLEMWNPSRPLDGFEDADAGAGPAGGGEDVAEDAAEDAPGEEATE